MADNVTVPVMAFAILLDCLFDVKWGMNVSPSRVKLAISLQATGSDAILRMCHDLSVGIFPLNLGDNCKMY